jgi:hypothetical protein
MSPGERRLSLRLRYYAADSHLRELHRAGDVFALTASPANATGRTIALTFPAVYCRSVADVPSPDGPTERLAELAPVEAGGTDLTWTISP